MFPYGNIQIHTKILKSVNDGIVRKIDIFQIMNKSRKKREIIYGLGTVLKFITGNLDSNDGDKINNILDNQQYNEIKLNEISNYDAQKYQMSMNTQLETD